MTKQLIILILYLVSSLTILILDFSYSDAIVIGIAFLFFGYFLVAFVQNANKPMEGEILFRRQSRLPRRRFIILAVLSIVVGLVVDRFNLVRISLIWLILFYDICLSILTRKIRPVFMVIDGNKLRLNDLGKSTRDLSKLKNLNLNGFSNKLELLFVNGDYLSIRRREYLEADMDKLIEVCLDRSKEDVFVSENLRKR